MNRPMASPASLDQSTRMERYYRFHAKIYDATRWSFLFGRQEVIRKLAATRYPLNILEVGCGTGKNLINLARRFPRARVTGLDISESMLDVARKNLGPLARRIELVHASYDQPLGTSAKSPFDLILFAYSLTMINPGWESALECAYEDLFWGGSVAVVDFHDAGLPVFEQWMGLNHVRMDGHLLPKLEHHFRPQTVETRAVYGGLWRYLMFIGEKEA